MATRNEDFLEHLFVGTNHQYMMFFTQKGKVFWMRVYEIPEGGKNTKGRAMQNLINIEQDDKVKAFLVTKDLKDEDYKDFYKELYPMQFEEPLFNIHLNVDYPFNLTGILYFPKISANMEVQKDKIQLYSKQVFITDSVEGIVPDFLTLLHGVIDSPDIPLNVSRSYLQADGAVKKIASHISKKVSDKLEELFKKDRADFEAKWDDIKIFIEYGILSDEKFAERAKKFTLYKTTEGKYYTMDELTEKITPAQKDKNDKKYSV